MILLNHREIEFYTNKRWKEHNTSIHNLNDIFSQWADETQKTAVLNMMDWLRTRGEALFDDDLIMDYGTDCLRIYLMFEKEPKENDKYYDSWEECNLEGAYKFIGKYRRLILTAKQANEKGLYSNIDASKLLRRVDELKSESVSYMAKGNTMPNRHNAISCIMEGFKEIQGELNIGEYIEKFHSHEIEEAIPKSEARPSEHLDNEGNLTQNPSITKLCLELICMMTPFAPYLSDDLLQEFEKGSSVLELKFKTDEKSDIVKKIIIPLQINGKTKKVLEFLENATEDEIKQTACQEAKRYIKDNEYKIIYVDKKIINFVK